jgi:hypothetical protein
MFQFAAIIGLIIFAALAVILIVAANKPDSFRVERSITINASPDGIATLINDFHHWQIWSPWAHIDPNMKTIYSGPATGVGSVYEWEGNAKVGKGRMEIVSVEPARTSIKLDFLKPFEGHNIADFILTPQASPAATRVDWVMQGPSPFFPSKIMGVFIAMDKMIGPDFEKGLANLKGAAER